MKVLLADAEVCCALSESLKVMLDEYLLWWRLLEISPWYKRGQITFLVISASYKLLFSAWLPSHFIIKQVVINNCQKEFSSIGKPSHMERVGRAVLPLKSLDWFSPYLQDTISAALRAVSSLSYFVFDSKLTWLMLQPEKLDRRSAGRWREQKHTFSALIGDWRKSCSLINVLIIVCLQTGFIELKRNAAQK